MTLGPWLNFSNECNKNVKAYLHYTGYVQDFFKYLG